MVVAVRHCDNERRRFVLAVVPGDRRVSFDAIARVLRGRGASLASTNEAAMLTNCAMGAVPPFSFHPQLELMVDEDLMAEPQICRSVPGHLDLFGLYSLGRLPQAGRTLPEERIAA